MILRLINVTANLGECSKFELLPIENSSQHVNIRCDSSRVNVSDQYIEICGYGYCGIEISGGGALFYLQSGGNPQIIGDFTGKRYVVEDYGVLSVRKSGPNYLPGTEDGICRNGGLYK